MKLITIVAIVTGILVGCLATGTAASFMSHRDVYQQEVVTQEPAGFHVGITAPTEVSIGDLVVLEVTGPEAQSYKWKIVPASDNFLVIDDGKRAVFSHGSLGDFMFILSGAKDGEVDVITHNLHVSAQPSYSGLDAKVSQWVKGVKTNKEEAVKLANSFKTVAMVAKSGQIKDVSGFIEATKAANQDALGASLVAWTPFRESLNKELSAKAEAGELPDLDAHIQFWVELSEALKAVPFEEGLKNGPTAVHTLSSGVNSRSSPDIRG